MIKTPPKNIVKTLIKVSSSWIYLTGIMAVIVISLIIYGTITYLSNANAGFSDKYVASENQIDYMRPLSLDERYRWRSPSKYTLVIYESLDCKFCRKLNTEINTYKSHFVGKFNLAYRNAPLVDLEPLAAEKALISECVFQESGTEKMFAYIDSIYSDYKQFATDNAWAKDRAKQFLTHPEKLNSCLDDNLIKEKIESDIQGLLVDGVNYLPSIGIYYDGKLVGRYASGFGGTMRVMSYLSTFEDNADQFWSDALYKKIHTGIVR